LPTALKFITRSKVSTVSFDLRNISDRRAAITGYKVSCECMTGDEMPFVIDPGEVRKFQFRVDSDTRGKGFTREIMVHPGEASATLALTQVDV
jgi:hypothetical protein